MCRLLSLSLLVVSTLGVGVTAQQSRGAMREPANNLEWAAAHNARDQKGLPAAAALYGRYSAEEGLDGITAPGDVATIAWESHAVVAGHIDSQTARITPDQRHIVTEYRVQIDRVLKGDPVLAPAQAIVVSVPGGRVVFADGSVAETRPVRLSDATWPSNQPIAVGRSYILFLDQIEGPEAGSLGRAGTYRPAMGSYGILEILDRQPWVVPMAGSQSPAVQEMAGARTLEEVFTRIDQSVGHALSHPGVKELRPVVQ
jgi:hypothetical protein